MAERAKRAFAFFLALLFLITSVGFTIVVLIQMRQDKQQNKTEETNVRKLEGYSPTGQITKLAKADLKEGDGKVAKKGDTVTVHYTGALAATGVIFQSSKDLGQPVTLSLKSVIKGWTIGVPGMREGGVRRLIIPAELAYGKSSPSEDIPANSDMVFDIELIKAGVKK